MLTLHSFHEAQRLTMRGLLPFRLLQDQAAVLWAYVDSASDSQSAPFVVPFVLPADFPTVPWLITGEQIDALSAQAVASVPYADLLGGDVHVCESEADLLSVVGMDMEFADAHGGRWPNVTELPMAWDSCTYVTEANGESHWVLFLLCWSDAGGPVFYVPKHLWTAARVEEHMALTNAAWA